MSFLSIGPSIQNDNFTCVRWSHHHHQLSCHSCAVEETSAKHQPVASVHATSPAWKREGAHRRFLSLSLSTLQPGKCATLTSMTATKKILHQDQSKKHRSVEPCAQSTEPKHRVALITLLPPVAFRSTTSTTFIPSTNFYSQVSLLRRP